MDSEVIRLESVLGEISYCWAIAIALSGRDGGTGIVVVAIAEPIRSVEKSVAKGLKISP